MCWHHARGGEGAADLGKALAAACEQPANFRFLYPLELSIKVPLPALSCHCLRVKTLACKRGLRTAPLLRSLPAATSYE